MGKWVYLESGVGGYTEVTSPYIPNPNSQPITSLTESTREEGLLANGDTYYIYPETKTRKHPIQFTWNFQSGATDVINKFIEWAEQATKVKIKSDVPGEEWVVRVKSVEDTKTPYGTEDYRNIVLMVDWLE